MRFIFCSIHRVQESHQISGPGWFAIRANRQQSWIGYKDVLVTFAWVITYSPSFLSHDMDKMVPITNCPGLGLEPWSSGNGRRLMFQRLWVRILALYTGWTFFHIPICCKICNVVRKDENKRKRGRSWPIFFKKTLTNWSSLVDKIRYKLSFMFGDVELQIDCQRLPS